MYDICSIAHITKDINTTPDGVKEMPGGTAYYFSIALQKLPVQYYLITKLAETDFHLLKELDNSNVIAVPSSTSHFYENIYQDYSDNRQQKVHNLAEPFVLADIPEVTAKYFHLGPLSKYDTSVELMMYLKKFGKLSIDAQGLLRDIVNHEVSLCKWEQMEVGLPLIDVIKVNEFEAEMLSGFSDPEKAAIRLSKYGIAEVVLTLGGKGSMIYSEGKFHEIPAYKPTTIKDATGCGDTYMAGYLYKRSKGGTIEDSGKFGAAMATLKMEDFGPFRGEESEIMDLIH